ncbi:MAG: apolipoprotein N-acyltransferase [Phycisphaerales bacterium]|nr:apolipoprotein N-acyltransferase [Phycisphaerales bacterium]
MPGRAPSDRSGTAPNAPRRWWRPALIGGFLHGILMALAFDPIGWWPLAIAAIAPLVWAAIRIERAMPASELTLRAAFGKRAWLKLMLAVWAGCMPMFLFEKAWIFDVSAGGYPLLAGYMALYPALFVLLLVRIVRCGRWGLWGLWGSKLPLGISAGILWAGIEFFRGEVLFKGYGWLNIVHPLAQSPWMSAAGAVVGVYGVCLLTACVTASLSAIWCNQRAGVHRAALAAVAIVWVCLSVVGAGSRSVGDGPRRILRIGIVQTNLPQSNKIAPTYESTRALWRDLERLTLEAAAGKPDMIAWPETMKPGLALDAASVKAERDAAIALFPADKSKEPVSTASFAEATMQLQKAIGCPLLVGEDAYDKLRFGRHPEGGLKVEYDHRYNSAMLVAEGKVQERRYDKVRLTPFGEEMPYISAWPWLADKLLDLAARGMRLDLSSGRELTVFSVPLPDGSPARFVTPICFEATQMDLCRHMVFDGSTRRADVMINMTNDGWFGWWKAGRSQHLQIARWRAIELETPVIRAANTGISCIIDADGRVRRISAGAEGVDWNQAGVLVDDVVLPTAVTPFVRGGWILGWVVLAGAGALVLISLIPRRSPSRTSPLQVA